MCSKFKLLKVVVSMALVVCGMAKADVFSTEIGLERSTYQANDGTDRNVRTARGVFYTQAVELNSRRPFNELAFLQKINKLTFDYGVAISEDTSFLSAKVPIYGLSGEFHDDHLFLGLRFQSQKKDAYLKINPAQFYEKSTQTSGVSYGYYFFENTLITLESNRDVTRYSPGQAMLSTVGDLTKSSNGLAAHSVFLMDEEKSLVLDFSLLRVSAVHYTDLSKIYGNEGKLKAQFYMRPNIYVEAGALVNKGNDAYYAGTTHIYGLGYAATPRLIFSTQSQKFVAENPSKGPSHTQVVFYGGYRF